MLSWLTSLYQAALPCDPFQWGLSPLSHSRGTFLFVLMLFVHVSTPEARLPSLFGDHVHISLVIVDRFHSKFHKLGNNTGFRTPLTTAPNAIYTWPTNETKSNAQKITFVNSFSGQIGFAASLLPRTYSASSVLIHVCARVRWPFEMLPFERSREWMQMQHKQRATVT